MEVPFFHKEHVRTFLPMNECIDVMSNALSSLADNRALMPRRNIFWLPEKVGALGTMPAYLADQGVIGLKAITAFPGNHGTDYETHQGVVLLFDGGNGSLMAAVDAAEITAIRTAAVSAVASRVLANPEASDLVILGSGVQASKHLEAMLLVRDIKRVRVWNPFPGLAEEFAETHSKKHGIAVEAQSGEKAELSGTDIVCTTTSSLEPVLFGADLHAGIHVNAVGSSFPHARELDTEAMKRARLFVDLRESALNESGDFLIAKSEGAVNDNHIRGEIGEILLGKVPGRQHKTDITVFESLGLAVEDVAAACHVYGKAQGHESSE